MKYTRNLLPSAVVVRFSCLIVAPVYAQRDSTEGKQAAEQFVTESTLRAHLTFIASDELQGRNTPSPGLDAAAAYIAEHVKSWGLKPMGGDGTYFQKIYLRRSLFARDKSSGKLGDDPVKYGDDFLARAAGDATGKLVYVSHGYVIPSKGIDAYKGIDVRGKFLIVTGNSPQEVSFADLTRMERGKDYLDVRLYAEKNGAAGIISLPSAETTEAWEGLRRAMEQYGSNYAPDFSGKKQQAEKTIPSIIASPVLMTRLFAGEKTAGDVLVKDKPTESFNLSPDKILTLHVEKEQDEVTTQNVVAVVEGSDPKLKEEYVAFGAHYDHLGVGRPDERGDSIYNGADDDGSGTVSLLAMAEAFGSSKVKPKRSILFVWHCGEEKGLWGSQYFTTNPTVPLSSIITQLNIDMIGRSRAEGDDDPRNANLSGPNSIYVIGSRMMSSELGDLAARVNNSYLNLGYDYRYDDLDDPNRFFYRSDHYNYAKHGIPIIFWFDGVHADYHRPSDEISKIDFVKMSKVARTIFLTGVELANRDKRPLVDKTPAQ